MAEKKTILNKTKLATHLKNKMAPPLRDQGGPA